jgi:hypothetical protein
LIFGHEKTVVYAMDEELYGSYAEVGHQAKTVTTTQVEANASRGAQTELAAACVTMVVTPPPVHDAWMDADP